MHLFVCLLFLFQRIIKVLANGYGFVFCVLFALISAFVFRVCVCVVTECWFLPWHCLFCNHDATQSPLHPATCLAYNGICMFQLWRSKAKTPPSTKKRHPHRWTIDVGPGVFYICSANGNLYTSKWKAQKALQKCFPNAFFHFFLLYFIQLCSKE